MAGSVVREVRSGTGRSVEVARSRRAAEPGAATWGASRPAFGVWSLTALVLALVLGIGGCGSLRLPRVDDSLAPETLAPEEGLLVLQVDTDRPIRSLGIGDRQVIEPVPRGRMTWVVRLPAGRYDWRSIQFQNDRGRGLRLRLDPKNFPREGEHRFEVRAGRLNYVGELVVRGSGTSWRSTRLTHYFSVRVRNHAARAVRTLLGSHAALMDRFRLHYGGPTPDGFIDYFVEQRSLARAAVGQAGGDEPMLAAALLPPPSDGEGTDSEVTSSNGTDGEPGPATSRDESRDGPAPDLFFPTSGISRIRLSPGGHWIAASGYHDRKSGLLIQRVGGAAIEGLYSERDQILGIDWAGEDTLLVGMYLPLLGTRTVLRVDLTYSETDAQIVHRQSWIGRGSQDDVANWLVDALPMEEETAIWEFESGGRNSIHRVDLEEVRRYLGRRTHSDYRAADVGVELASLAGSVHRWVVDREGRPVAAARREEDGYSLWVRDPDSGELEPALTYADGAANLVYPQALSADGETLIVTAYHGRDTIGLHEFDLRTRTVGREIHRRPDADLVDVVTDGITGELVGAVYESEGKRQVHYFEEYVELAVGGTEIGGDAVPANVVSDVKVVSRTRDRGTFVYLTTATDDPGTFYLKHASSGRTMRIGSAGEGLRDLRLSRGTTFEVESFDGTRIESFLTLPRDREGPFPLIVMPHGGPVGVRDRRTYDPVVQFWAASGFAVLQPNYRGSAGYGRAFQEAGHRQWARGIEADIEAAVEYAAALPEVDAERTCMFGASYGGFSAVASLVRRPDRYRCAVTINGVSDIPLLTETSDYSDSRLALERFKQRIGDFEQARDELIGLSPAYRTASIRTPVMVVYGSRDRRVDPDHAHRLILMLALHGRSFEELRVPGARHSFDREHWIRILPEIRRFVRAYVGL